MVQIKILQVIQLTLIIIAQVCYFGATKPSLPEREVIITTDFTSSSKVQAGAYPTTPAQVDHLMYVLQFNSPDIPKLLQIYKQETKDATLFGKLEAAIEIFRKIDYTYISDEHLLEIIRINILLKGTYCKNSTHYNASEPALTEQTMLNYLSEKN